jgi:hypothetical protein
MTGITGAVDGRNAAARRGNNPAATDGIIAGKAE